VSRTKIRTWVFRDPLMRKAHAHSVRTKEPDLDEELELWLNEELDWENHSRQEDDTENTDDL
jgi:hypothetical protein